MTLTDPDGGCDVVGCTNDPEPPEYDLCEDHIGWEDRIDDIILDVETGDRVEFEYDNAEGTKTGAVVGDVSRGYRPRIRIDVDGSDHVWTIGNGISVSYQHRGRGEQTRHLGNLESIRVIDE